MAPLTVEQALQIACQHHQAGRLAQAGALCRQILERQAHHPDALHLLGIMACQVGQYGSAVKLIGRAVACRPNWPEAYSNLGTALKNDGRPDEAVAACRHALALNPALPEAYNNLGTALRDQGQLDEAVAAYRQALALKPNLPEAYSNLGNALKDQRQFDAAIAAYRQAIVLKPNLAEAHSNLGNVLRATGQLEAAIAACRQAIAVKPNYLEAYINLGNALRDQGQFDAAVAAYRQAMALNPGYAEGHSSLILTLHLCPAYAGPALGEELRRWNLRHAEPLKQFIQPHTNDRSPERRLRVGYVSPDFRDHVVGRNLMPLFKHINREQFETFCYADVAMPDQLTEEFRRHAEVFRVVSGMSHAALAERIRADGIDILVDLALHTAGGRLLVFARQPAPVQATFAGYPGSTGLSTIDYRLTDPYLDPPENAAEEALYSEQSVRLPASFWCYDPLEARPPAVGPLPALAKGYVTFGCLNNFCKVNEGVLKLWAQVLAGVAGSRLVLLAEEGSHRERTIQTLEGLGVSRERVGFFAKRPRERYLELYHQIDIGLDTLPYNGHTTSLDSYFMGVPVVTLVGQTVVGRAGLSQLMNLGLPELIGRSEHQYVTIARELASDQARLVALRAGLRGRMQASSLMDGPAFARGIEAAYRQMWRQWCATIR